MGEIDNKYKSILNFNPVISTRPEEWRDYLYSFNAGERNSTFTDFLFNEYQDYSEAGDGATYVIINTAGIRNDNNPDIVGYFTISANAIPAISRVRDDLTGKVDEETWGIPVMEIKLFAINELYQDVFYESEELKAPISAWCLLNLVDLANQFINTVMGFKALFLHSVPEAEEFYKRNGFIEIKENMIPLQEIDSEYTPLWMPLREIGIPYDE